MATTINLDGTPRAFGFTLESARGFKENYVFSLLEAFQADRKGTPNMLDSVTLTWILWAGLNYKSEKVSFQKAEKLLQKYLDDGGKLSKLYKVVGEAARSCGLFGLDEDDDDSDPNSEAESNS